MFQNSAEIKAGVKTESLDLHICILHLLTVHDDNQDEGVSICEILYKPGAEWSCSLAVGDMSLKS